MAGQPSSFALLRSTMPSATALRRAEAVSRINSKMFEQEIVMLRVVGCMQPAESISKNLEIRKCRQAVERLERRLNRGVSAAPRPQHRSKANARS
jgi:hypothetical protein